MICEEKIELDLSKLKIQILPFETDDEIERYKFVKKAIEEFVSDNNVSDAGIVKKLMSIWQNQIFINGLKKDFSIELTKKDIVWLMIVILTDHTKMDSEFSEDFDCALYEEIVNKYSEVIEVCSEKYVLKKNGFKVTNLCIAQVKRKHGLIERVNYNLSKKGDQVVLKPS